MAWLGGHLLNKSLSQSQVSMIRATSSGQPRTPTRAILIFQPPRFSAPSPTTPPPRPPQAAQAPQGRDGVVCSVASTSEHVLTAACCNRVLNSQNEGRQKRATTEAKTKQKKKSPPPRALQWRSEPPTPQMSVSSSLLVLPAGSRPPASPAGGASRCTCAGRPVPDTRPLLAPCCFCRDDAKANAAAPTAPASTA